MLSTESTRVVRLALAVTFSLTFAETAVADEPKPRGTWHLELKYIGGGADYARPYSPVCFSPDSKRMAISFSNPESVWERYGSTESTVDGKDAPEGSGISIWNIENLEFIKWIETDAHKVIRFSPDGQSIAALDDSHLLVWDIESGEESRTTLIEKVTAFERLKNGFAWGPDGSVVVVKSGAIAHFDSDGVQLKTFSTAKTMDIVTLAATEDGREIVADCHYWNVTTDKQVTAKKRGFCHTIFRPGTSEVWGRSDRGYGAIANWNPLTGAQYFPIKEGLNSASSAANGTVQWEVEGIAFTPNGKVLASVGYDSCIHLWNVETGSRIATLELAENPRKVLDNAGVGRPTLKVVKFSPNGRWLLACSAKSVSIFSSERLKPHINSGTLHQVTQYFAGHDLVEEVVTNPRGAKTLVGSMLHTEVQKPGTRVAALKEENDEVWCDAVILAQVSGYGQKGIHYNIHYEGHSREDDARVPEWRLRPKLAPHLKVENLK